MAKIEVDIGDSLENSVDGDNDVLGMVDESSFGSGGDDKTHLVTQTFMDSGDEGYGLSNQPRRMPLTYRIVQMVSDELDSPGLASNEIFNTPGGATIERTGEQQIQTMLANPVNGQLYVINNTNEVYTPTLKNIMPRDANSKANNGKKVRPKIEFSEYESNHGKKRDDRRRATHNEVERRRRDKINNWIIRLSKVIPSLQDDKAGPESQSKGGILAKACEYIVEMKNTHQRYQETLGDNEKMAIEIVKLKQQVLSLKKETALLRNQLTQNGITPIADCSSSSSSTDAS